MIKGILIAIVIILISAIIGAALDNMEVKTAYIWGVGVITGYLACAVKGER